MIFLYILGLLTAVCSDTIRARAIIRVPHSDRFFPAMRCGSLFLVSFLSLWLQEFRLDALLLSKSGFDLDRWDSQRIAVDADGISEMSKSILLNRMTERSYSGRFISGERYNIKEEGVYVCALGGLPLFFSEHKFVSGTGWPSFYDVFDTDHLLEVPATDGGNLVEIVCARTGSHIGHVFPDTPPPALQRKFVADGIVKYDNKNFLRYCANAGALRFVPLSEMHTLK